MTYFYDDETECLEDMGLAAVTFPDSGSISQRVGSALKARFRRTVARKTPDLLMWATIVVCFGLLASGVL